MSSRFLCRWVLGLALVGLTAVAVPVSATEPATDGAHVVAAPEAGEAAEGHEHHVPKFEDYNFFYGFLGERDDVEPNFLWRPKGTPVPFGAMLLNSAVLYYLLIRFAKKPIAAALKSRKATILRGMDEAAQMKQDAESRLADYEHKLASIEQEIERVRTEMRSAGQSERKRILGEAKEKQARMERDAQTLISQELKAAREGLLLEMTRTALRSAEATIRTKVTAADQNRLAEDYLAGIKGAATALRGKV